jgi:hypothetical protein
MEHEPAAAPKFVRAVHPARMRTSRRFALAALLAAAGATAATAAAVALIPCERAPELLPAPRHHWRLDGDGLDERRGLSLVPAAAAVTPASDLVDGPPRYETGRHGLARAFGACTPRCAGRALVSARPLDLTHDLTLSAWVRADENSQDLRPIVASGRFVLGTRGARFWVTVDGATGHAVQLASSVPLEPDTWHHVAVTRRGPRLSLWIDGNESRLEHDVPARSSAAPLFVGRDAAGERWRGAIDDLQIWDRALLPSAITILATPPF